MSSRERSLPQTTWCDYARFILSRALSQGVVLKTGPERVIPISTQDYPAQARRPRNSRLDTRKLRATFNIEPPHWHYHASRLVAELTTQGAV